MHWREAESRGVSLGDLVFGGEPDTRLETLFGRAERAAGDQSAALALARDLGHEGSRPGTGQTRRHFEILATVGAADVTVARIVEPHLDALAILAECPAPVALTAIDAGDESTWGVFAAEGAGVRLDASRDGDRWRLDGTKPWCSLAGVLTHALVTAHLGSERALFAVSLREPGVQAHPESWVARGMPDVPSGPTDFTGVGAVPVGEPGWYLARPGFEWGGIGVAACWFGGAVGVGRRVFEAAARRGDDLSALAAGRVATRLTAARALLAGAADRIDRCGDDPLDTRQRALLAQLCRSTVREACDGVLHDAADALGPAPQALDAAYAARVADLSLYLLQDHGDRDLARAGRLVTEGAE